MTVAEANPTAEVFIYHQKPRRRFLRLFWHQSDGAFYYYRNGTLLVETSYRRDNVEARFEPEVDLYRRFSDGSPRRARLFLYFGHEIPEVGGEGYDASYDDRRFTVADLATGLDGLAPDGPVFDLLILSTCFNGTPYTVSSLTPHTRKIVASPDNLHLSYFNDDVLKRLDLLPEEETASDLAMRFARHSFDRLTEELQTAVSVAVYDVERTRSYVQSVGDVYRDTLGSLQDNNPAFIDHFDCADDEAFARPGMGEGVTVLYRPPQFGRMKEKTGHSGWECVRSSG